MVNIKICCIQDVEEARLAASHGVTVIGLVSAMPSGPGPIDEARIATVVRGLPPGLRAFLLTSRPDATAIIAQMRRTGAHTVQIVDRLMIGSYRDLREALPDREIVQVIHVEDDRALHDAQAVSDEVDAILLDSGRPTAAVKELGGTGRVHDWSVSRRVRDAVGIPVWLAGGLNPGNVAEAVGVVRPHGVDVCSGVRTHGRLDPAKLEAFVRAVRAAD